MPGVWLTNLYGPMPIGCFKAVLSNLLQVFLRHDNPPRLRWCHKGHEVGPGLMQMEAHCAGIYHLNVFNLRLEFRSPNPL